MEIINNNNNNCDKHEKYFNKKWAYCPKCGVCFNSKTNQNNQNTTQTYFDTVPNDIINEICQYISNYKIKFRINKFSDNPDNKYLSIIISFDKLLKKDTVISIKYRLVLPFRICKEIIKNYDNENDEILCDRNNKIISLTHTLNNDNISIEYFNGNSIYHYIEIKMCLMNYIDELTKIFDKYIDCKLYVKNNMLFLTPLNNIEKN
jgi:hypothetical protein